MGLISFFRANAPFLMAGVLLTFCSSFGQTFFISVFAGEIMAEFDLTDAQWGGIYTLGTLSSAIVMIWAGTLTDIFRVRRLGGFALGLLAFACLFMSWLPTASLLILAIFLLRLAGQGMMSHISSVAMARWYVAARGRALAVSSLGFAFGETVLPLLMVSLLAFFSWRSLWVGCAVVTLLMLPVLLRLLRLERTPQSVAKETEALGMQGRHWTRKQVLFHPLFWFLLMALLGPSAFNTAFFFQQVHIAEIKGWSHFDLVALFPLFTAVAVFASIISGFAIDRFGTARLFPIYQLPMVVAFLVFSNAETLWGGAVGIIFLALTAGGNSTISSAFWAEFYGTKYLGSVKAMATSVMVLGSAIGPGITGYLITAGVGFETQMIWIAGYFAIGSAMVGIGIHRVRPSLAMAS